MLYVSLVFSSPIFIFLFESHLSPIPIFPWSKPHHNRIFKMSFKFSSRIVLSIVLPLSALFISKDFSSGLLLCKFVDTNLIFIIIIFIFIFFFFFFFFFFFHWGSEAHLERLNMYRPNLEYRPDFTKTNQNAWNTPE